VNGSIKKFFEISLFNTVKLNFYYWGVGGLFHPRILASRNLKILKLQGKVNVKSTKAGAVQIGFGHVGIVDKGNYRSLWENSGEIIFEGVANMGPGSRIVNSGTLVIGDGFCINGSSSIICNKKISFGENVLISWDCLIMDTDFHCVLSLETGVRLNEDQEVKIGSHVWIGCRCTILKKARIPSNSVIAAGSVINKCYSDENSVYSTTGKIKEQINWIQ